jgi:hypothetical protein
MGGTPIESLEAAVYTVPTDAPEGDGTLTWDSTTMVLTCVRAGGVRGIGWTYGSAACAPVITGTLAAVITGTLAAVITGTLAAVITGTLAAVIRGLDAMDVAGAWEAMVRAVRNDGRPGAVGYGVSAVDAACGTSRPGTSSAWPRPARSSAPAAGSRPGRASSSPAASAESAG